MMPFPVNEPLEIPKTPTKLEVEIEYLEAPDIKLIPMRWKASISILMQKKIRNM